MEPATGLAKSKSMSHFGKGTVSVGGLDLREGPTKKVRSCRLTGTEERIVYNKFPVSINYRTNAAVSDIHISNTKMNGKERFNQSKASRVKTVPFGMPNKNMNQSIFASNHMGAIKSCRALQARQFNKCKSMIILVMMRH